MLARKATNYDLVSQRSSFGLRQWRIVPMAVVLAERN
jgi:hypothetical protein